MAATRQKAIFLCRNVVSPYSAINAGDADAACLAGTYAPAVSPFPAGKPVNHP